MLAAHHLAAFWLPPSPLVTLPPPSRADIAAFEMQTGHRLPELLVSLYEVQNGGWIRFPQWLGSDGTSTTAEFLLGFSPAWSTPQPPARTGEALLSSTESSALVLSWNHPGGDLPRVLFRRDDGDDVVLAETFAAFVAGLGCPDPEWRFGISLDDEALDDIADELGGVLACEVTHHSDDLYRGIVRGQSADGTEPATIWLRPNGRTDAAHDAPWSECTHIVEVDAEANTAQWVLQQLREMQQVDVLHEPRPFDPDRAL